MTLTAITSTIFQPFSAAAVAPPAPFVIFVDARAVQLDPFDGDGDALTVDPRAVQLVV